MIRKILFVSFCLLLLTWTASAFVCRPCEEVTCEPFKAADCQYGVTTKDCGCCDACHNGLGDRCGGFEGFLGGCGTGLKCQFPSGLVGQFPTGKCVLEADHVPRQ